MAEILPITDVLPLVCLAVVRSLALALEDEVEVVADQSVFAAACAVMSLLSGCGEQAAIAASSSTIKI